MNVFHINLMIALTWMGLSSHPGGASLIVGFIFGFFMLWTFQPLFKQTAYFRRTFGFLVFLVMFIRAMVLSSMSIAISIMFQSRARICPNIVTFDTTGMSESEIIFLTQCITLTPGTTSIKIDDDFKTIYVHAFDAKDPDQVRASIEQDLKQYILGFTR